MNIQHLIKRFNKPDVHLVISAWPEENSNHGIAWYTKLVVDELSKKKRMKFVVLAEKGLDNEPKIFHNGKVLVLRVFDNTHHSLYPTILEWLAKFPQIQNVSVHSEFGVNAGLKHYVLLIPFLALIKLTGRRVVYYAHNVVTDIAFLKTHFNFQFGQPVVNLINGFVRFHTKILGLLSDTVVVLDQALATRLSGIINPKKIMYMPIPVKRKTFRLSKAQAKRKLGIQSKTKVILTFGFISPYKGTDWIVDSFIKRTKRQKANYHLILAGGPAHSLKERPYYKEWFSWLTHKISQTTSITMTGFVPEKDIATYFSACDLVVLPYRGLMGASGTLTHTLSFGKPFMVSTAMSDIVQNEDVKDAIAETGLTKDHLFFPLTDIGMKNVLRTLRIPKIGKSLGKFSRLVADSRSIEARVKDEYNQIYSPYLNHEKHTNPFIAWISPKATASA